MMAMAGCGLRAVGYEQGGRREAMSLIPRWRNGYCALIIADSAPTDYAYLLKGGGDWREEGLQ